MSEHAPCVGRFAPSPSGPLHFGSLVAAVASFLQARAQGGRWLVRIEDLDSPREAPGAADQILRTLECLGLHWDGEVMYQSRRHEAYAEALDRLAHQGMIYPCTCSRREIADSSLRGIDGPVYPGTCRAGTNRSRSAHALRLLTDDRMVVFVDRWQGRIERRLAHDYGDFVLRRADGVYAYQLAVVVDDSEQGITEVVRGVDLLDSTPRQIYLQQLMGFATPRYAHHAVVLNEAGQKLSKQTFARTIDAGAPLAVLPKVLSFLRQRHRETPDASSLAEFWRAAVVDWNPQALCGLPAQAIS